MSQTRPVSPEKEALNSSEVCSTDFASTPGPSSAASPEKIEGSTMEGCSDPETTETKHLDDLDQLQTSTSEVNEEESLIFTVNDEGSGQDICTSDTNSSIESDSELPLTKWHQDLHVNQSQQQDISVEFLQRIPGPSTAASSEKIDAETFNVDSLKPPLGNLEDDLAIWQKKCYELQQRISQLKEQLRQSEEEKQNLQADLGKYLFLEEKEKRRERLLGRAAPVQDPGFSLHERLLEISNSLSAEEVKQIKFLAKSKVNGFRLARCTEAFELFEELASNGEFPCDYIGKLLAGIQRYDLVDKLGIHVPLPGAERDVCDKELQMSDQIASEAVDTDYDCNQYASIPSSDSSDETNSHMPVLYINAESSSSSKLQSAFNAEEYTQLPNFSADCFLFDSSCSTTITSSDLLVNSTETTQAAASNCTSQASRDSNDGSPMLTSVNSHSVFGSNEFLSGSGSGLNPTSSEKEALSSSHAGEESEQHENGEVTGVCAAGSEERVERSVDLHVRTQSGTNVGNVPWSQQGAFPSAEMAAGGTDTSGAFNGTATDWERLGARPKQSRAQHSAIKQMPGEPFIPLTDGLAGDFLARHTQDKALHDSLYQSVGAEMSLFNDTASQGASYIDGVITVSAERDTANDDASVTMPEQGARQEAQKTNLPLGNHSSSTISHGGDCHFPALCSSDPTGARLGSTTSWPSLDPTGNTLLPHEDVRNSTLPAAHAVSSCDPTRATGLDSSTTSWPSLIRHSSNTTTVGDDVLAKGSASGTTIPEPSCGNADNCRTSVLNNRNFGTDSVESTDNSLLALEQRITEACALVERVLREREERKQFAREIERKEQLIREQRARERREREEREIQEVERWPHRQESITAHSQWSCEHYQRHCTVRFPCCGKFYPCHRCHNISKACDNEEAKAYHASHLKCSHCQHEQEIGEDSEKCRVCGSKMSVYFCSSCLNVISADNNPHHCEKCGICRIHKDKSFHCEVCNVCLDKRLEGNHNCRPDSGHEECCFCLEDTFSGCQILPCSHKVHRECAIKMIQCGIRTCPICDQPLRTVEHLN